MRFDLYTISLLTLRDDAPDLDEGAAAALQDAHLAHNTAMRAAGHLLVAGSIQDARYRGLSIWSPGPERVRELCAQDPSVRAGRLSAEVLRWMVPDGTAAFSAAAEVPLDRLTITLLAVRPDAPALDEGARAALQDAHLAHNADLHQRGHLLTAGPLRHDALRVLGVWRLEPEQTQAQVAEDPLVRAGRLAAATLPWLVPSGAIAFPAGQLPRSRAEAAYE